MVEVHENPTLVAMNRLREHERAQAAARSEPPPSGNADFGALADALSGDVAFPAPPGELASEGGQTLAGGQTLQTSSAPPPDPGAAFRHGRLAVLAVLAVILIFAWIRQRRAE